MQLHQKNFRASNESVCILIVKIWYVYCALHVIIAFVEFIDTECLSSGGKGVVIGRLSVAWDGLGNECTESPESHRRVSVNRLPISTGHADQIFWCDLSPGRLSGEQNLSVAQLPQ